MPVAFKPQQIERAADQTRVMTQDNVSGARVGNLVSFLDTEGVSHDTNLYVSQIVTGKSHVSIVVLKTLDHTPSDPALFGMKCVLVLF